MHRNFLSGGAPDFISDAADIIIRSATHELSYSRAIKPLTYESLARVRLHEDEGWRLRELEGWGFRRGGGGGQHVGSGEVMRKVLQNVQGLLVRGGFYRGSEIAVLHTLKVSAAAAAASSPSSSYGTSSGTSSSAKPENSGGGGGRRQVDSSERPSVGAYLLLALHHKTKPVAHTAGGRARGFASIIPVIASLALVACQLRRLLCVCRLRLAPRGRHSLAAAPCARQATVV